MACVNKARHIKGWHDACNIHNMDSWSVLCKDTDEIAGKSSSRIETEMETMATHVIQDWTSTEVPMKRGPTRDVEYKVYKDGTRLFQEIRDSDQSPIHTLELPQGMALERSSYEVLLRYVLVDIVNA